MVYLYLYPVEDHKNRTSNYLMHFDKLNLKSLEFPMKVKDIPKFENLNNLNVNVFELTGTVVTPIQINKNYLQPQIDLLLFENHYCLIKKLHCLINKSSHMKCQKQQPTNITFSWKDHLKFEEYHMKVPVPIRVYADFECINQPSDDPKGDPKVLFKQIPIAVGFYLISPFGIEYYSYFGVVCTEGQQSVVAWFVNEMLTFEKIASEYFETNIPLEIFARIISTIYHMLALRTSTTRKSTR